MACALCEKDDPLYCSQCHRPGCPSCLANVGDGVFICHCHRRALVVAPSRPTDPPKDKTPRVISGFGLREEGQELSSLQNDKLIWLMNRTWLPKQFTDACWQIVKSRRDNGLKHARR